MRKVNGSFDEFFDFDHDGKLNLVEEYERNKSECLHCPFEDDRKILYDAYGIRQEDREEIERYHNIDSKSSHSSNGQNNTGGIGCGTMFLIIMAIAFLLESCGA